MTPYQQMAEIAAKNLQRTVDAYLSITLNKVFPTGDLEHDLRMFRALSDAGEAASLAAQAFEQWAAKFRA